MCARGLPGDGSLAARSDGFTVVEVLLALVVLVVGLLALASVATMTTRSIVAASRFTRAAAAAGSEIEKLLARACVAGEGGEGKAASSGRTEHGEFIVDWASSSGGTLTDIVVVLQIRGSQTISPDSFVSARACLR